ncbi:uncharacterized protein ACNS7B_003269 isoform 3-T3 [Menidia menidia]
MTCSSPQEERSISSEEEEPTGSTTKGSSEDVPSGENEKAAAGQQPVGGAVGEPEKGASSAASWEESGGRKNFLRHRQRARRLKVSSAVYATRHLDDSSETSESD